jgi:capsular exopolysaccharide synthesis family protein
MEYLRILRRRWWVLLVATLLGFSVAFATQPSNAVPVTKAPAPVYTAYSTLISDPLASQGSAFGVQWDKLSLLITKGDVPEAVERRLGTLRLPPTLSAAVGKGGKASRKRGTARAVSFPFATVTAAPDPSTGALVISALSYDRLYAVQMANLFTAELLRYLRTIGIEKYNNSISGLTSLRNSLQARVDSLNAQITAGGPNVASLQSQQQAASKQVDSTNQSLFQTTQSGPQQPNLRSLEAASPARTLVLGQAVVRPAITKSQRTLIGAAVGFLLGLAGLLVFEFLNARIRDVSGTEAAARMPLVAEIPALKMSRADRFRVLTAEDPASLMAEAYRSLRTSILAMWQRHPNAHGTVSLGHGTGAASAGPAWRPLRTLLITSPGPAEGKSVSAVNLAATFAETGASVIVIDADFRRPQLDRYFQRQAVPNLGDLGLDMSTKDFEAVLQETNIPGVRFAASSPPKSSPGVAMATAKAAVVIAKELSDIVIIDSPPLLLANDASDLSTFADATVLLVRAGWTRHKAVAGAADLLRRLEATTVGVVLVGAEHGAHDGYYGYYGYYGYGYGYGRGESVEDSLRHRLMPWRRPRPDAAEPTREEVGVKATGEPGGKEQGPEAPPGRSQDEPWV